MDLTNFIICVFSGLHIFDVAPQWALPNSFMQWIDLQALVAHNNTVQNLYDLHHKETSITESRNSNKHSNLSETARHDDERIVLNSDVLIPRTVDESLFAETRKVQKDNRLDNCRKEFLTEVGSVTSDKACSFARDKVEDFSNLKKLLRHETDIACASENLTDTRSSSIARSKVVASSVGIECNKQTCDPDCNSSVANNNEPLNLVIDSKESARRDRTRDRFCGSYQYTSVVDKGTLPVDGAILRQEIDHSPNVQSYNAKYKNVDYGLLKLSDLELSCNSDKGKELFKSISKLNADSEVNGKSVTNGDFKPERVHILDKYVTHILPPRSSSDSKPKVSSWTHLHSNVKCNSIKKECCIEEEAHKSENTDLVAACSSALGNWACFEMSGQYPGHSRPPVGTPPPQTVWNHLTMAQGQGNFRFLDNRNHLIVVFSCDLNKQ